MKLNPYAPHLCAGCYNYLRDCVCARTAAPKPTTRNVVYISGPMTGLPEFNYPAFHAAATAWREAGWEVLNPAENFEGRTDKTYAEYIREDMKMLLRADAIAMLSGWAGSRGAKWELHTAQLLGLPAYVAEAAVPTQLWDVEVRTRVVYP